MSGAGIDLRDEMSSVMLARLEAGQVDLFEAAVACMGCAAIAIGAMHEQNRAQVAGELAANLLKHANKRAEELRRG